MKVCSLYGAGFYYMPGTDMCIKIGGWVRMELTGGNAFNGNMTTGALNALTNQRTTSNVGMRARGYITADAREQTAYGVARAYIAAGVNTNDTGLQVTSLVDSVNRAFVQWAGFTGGLAVSFYDFYSVPAMTYRGGYMPGSDTGDPGWWVLGYTAQFGGGFSGTLALEQRRTTQICDANAPASTACTIAPGGYTSTVTGSAAGIAPGNGAYGGEQIPDIVGNLRVDQAWGSAQIMAAYHDVNASYYGSTPAGAPSVLSGGHPADAAGWAVGAGLKVNFPMVAAGDYFQSQFNYTQGALRYVFATDNYNYGAVNGMNETYGIMTDCVYGGGGAAGGNTGCQLTSAWGFNAGYEHYWTPQWHQSVFGAYGQVSYGNSGNAMLCVDEGLGSGSGSAATATPGCNNNWSTWTVGSRLQWDVTKSFYVGVEALYTAMNGATTPTGALPTPVAFGSATGYQASASAWAFTLRMHKDFLP